MTRPNLDLSLYLVAGSDDAAGRSLTELVVAAVRGGVSVVQLREKGRPEGEVVELAIALRQRLAPLGVRLIINDNPDVALAAEADGVHLGQDDSTPEIARKIIGSDRILGVSAGNAQEMGIVDRDLVDYVGVGPVFATDSKADAGAAIGLDGLVAMRRLTSLPMVAIGGIQQETALAVMACGVEGIAVVSAICAAHDPEGAARVLIQRIAAGGADFKNSRM